MNDGFTSEVVQTFVKHHQRFSPRLDRAAGFATSACSSFVTCFNEFANQQSQLLNDLLSKSSQYLEPFIDPLRTEIALPSFFAGAREELYSDMLGWMLRLLGTSDVFRVLGIVAPPIEPSVPLEFKREYWVQSEESIGRFDLLLSQGDSWLVVIEVKSNEYQSSDLEKHELYNAAISAMGADSCAKIFVALEETGSDLRGGFVFRSWADVCATLRLLAPSVVRSNQYTHAALYLTFLTTIEQNLLGVTADRRSSIPDAIHYVGRVLKEYEKAK